MWSKTDNEYVLNAVSRHEFRTTRNLFFVYTYYALVFFVPSFVMRISNAKPNGDTPFIRFTLWSIFINFVMRARTRAWCVRACVTCDVARVCVRACAHHCQRYSQNWSHEIYFCASDHIVQIYYAIRVRYKYIRNSAHFCDSCGIIMGFQEKEYAFVCICKSQGMYRHEATWSNATD